MQELHVEPTPLHLHVAVTVLQVTAVAGGLGHQFIVKDFSSEFMFQPHSNFDSGGLSDKVLPQIQPVWNALLNMCCFLAVLHGGIVLEDPNFGPKFWTL